MPSFLYSNADFHSQGGIKYLDAYCITHHQPSIRQHSQCPRFSILTLYQCTKGYTNIHTHAKRDRLNQPDSALPAHAVATDQSQAEKGSNVKRNKLRLDANPVPPCSSFARRPTPRVR